VLPGPAGSTTGWTGVAGAHPRAAPGLWFPMATRTPGHPIWPPYFNIVQY